MFKWQPASEAEVASAEDTRPPDSARGAQSEKPPGLGPARAHHTPKPRFLSAGRSGLPPDGNCLMVNYFLYFSQTLDIPVSLTMGEQFLISWS